VSLNSV
jgi:hypothetical protein